MQPPDGELFHLRGEYREVDPPERLVFTFEWEDPDPDDVTNVVTLTFVRPTAARESCSIRARSRRRLAMHCTSGGWTDSFVRLAAALEESARAA